MKSIIPGVYMFSGLVLGRVYLLEDPDGLTIIDAGLGFAAAKILKQLAEKGHSPQDVKRILITHAHPDHIGGLRALQQATGAMVVCAAAEKPYIEGSQPIPRAPKTDLRGFSRLMYGKATLNNQPVPVNRTLHDGEIMPDVLSGLQAVMTPGHSPGHTSYWHPEKGILFSGDVIMRMVGLSLPIAAFTPSMAENKRSIKRIVELQPRIFCFGHGEPLRENTTAIIRQFAQKVGAL